MDEDKLKEGNRFYLSRKLIIVVGIFIFAASGLTVLTNFSINMIAASGDYSALLSQWNHYHYQAGMHVERLSRKSDKKHFEAYLQVKAQKDSLRNTIDELFSEDPDVETVFRTFDTDEIYPSEISGLITVFRYFNSSRPIQELRHNWEKLKEIEHRQHELIVNWFKKLEKKDSSDSLTQAKLEKYNSLNDKWNDQNRELMASVGDASGVVKQFGLWISVILGILLVLIGVVFSVRANKSIGRWEEALYEKEVMLMEIHHRVKNNMAVISGMLELESMSNGNADKALKESRDRIKSMAMIHEKLYQSNSFSEVDLAAYMKELTNHICSTYITKDKNITLESNLGQVQLNINQAVPVGLIINEIMANAIEHGFDGRQSGTIKIGMHQVDKKVHIQIKDDGKGISADDDFENSESTGSAIIAALIQQIDGELSVEDNGGLNITLTFEKSDASGSSNALFE
ncbi:sensor histidine kinase [Fodinibius sp.]|uniref:sensor histidine kinase n=1 Tax=Fodinibius sp. TaxID=1872440 RepID=UPI002ACD8676|nr:histidine kinase dimerization/phosphoacceptor domain -containing protein [Fodinibius sp.]MDZ7659004.1 histidine kinase dimerization/phosphoacceptor domain -containing protein [Fodinibius sp.]